MQCLWSSDYNTGYLILSYPASDFLRHSHFGNSISFYDLWSRPWKSCPVQKWPDLPHSFCNFSHSVPPLVSSQSILLLQTNLLCLLFHLLLPGLLRSSSLSLASHLKTLSSSLLSTCPYHLTPFAVANRSIVSFNPNKNKKFC